MTSYALDVDFIAAFSQLEYDQLTDKDQTGTPDCTGFDNAIALASEMIDAAIGGRYTVPLAMPVAGIIEQCCLDIARYFLHDDAITEIIQKRYDQAMKTLENIRNGNFILVGAALVNPALSGKGATVSTGSAAVFTDEYLSKML